MLQFTSYIDLRDDDQTFIDSVYEDILSTKWKQRQVHHMKSLSILIDTSSCHSGDKTEISKNGSTTQLDLHIL